MTIDSVSAARPRKAQPLSRRLLCGATLAAVLACAPLSARAEDRYWDANGTAVGSGGTGTWNLANLNWSPNGDGVSGPFAEPWNNGDLDNAVFGIQNQFTDTVSIAALGAGQHNDLRIDLDSEFFSGESFNEIFGDDVSDLDVASAFQFYISKNGGAQGSPVTVYIDNVRFVVPEPATFGLLGVGAVVLGAMRRRRSH